MLDTKTLRAHLRAAEASDEDLAHLVELVNGLTEKYRAADVPANDPEVLVVRLAVATRAWVNPTGAVSTTGTIDDWQESYRYAEGSTSGIYLTDAERRVLQGLPPDLGGLMWAGSLPYSR